MNRPSSGPLSERPTGLVSERRTQNEHNKRERHRGAPTPSAVRAGRRVLAQISVPKSVNSLFDALPDGVFPVSDRPLISFEGTTFWVLA